MRDTTKFAAGCLLVFVVTSPLAAQLGVRAPCRSASGPAPMQESQRDCPT